MSWNKIHKHAEVLIFKFLGQISFKIMPELQSPKILQKKEIEAWLITITWSYATVCIRHLMAPPHLYQSSETNKLHYYVCQMYDNYMPVLKCELFILFSDAHNGHFTALTKRHVILISSYSECGLSFVHKHGWKTSVLTFYVTCT